MLKVGLTGGVASGKSAVAAEFARLGVPIADADEVARELTQPGQEGLERLRAALGESILDAQGGLDRGRLRPRLFADAALRRQVEQILHPLILETLQRKLEARLAPYSVAVIPLLTEVVEARRLVNRVLVVDAPETTRLQRLMSRDGENETAARRMLGAQASRATRLAIGDDMLMNTGNLADLRKAVAALHAFYLELAADPDHPRPGLRLP